MATTAHDLTGSMDVAALGQEVRRARRRTGLSVEQLAARSGVSTGLVSQLERGRGNPSFQTLTRLADAFGIPLSHLLAGAHYRGDPVVRADARTLLPDLTADSAAGEHLVRELLTPSLQYPLQVIRTVMPAGFSNESRPFRHLGIECVHVLSGALHVTLGDAQHELVAGDTITYECTDAHWWSNPGTVETVVLGSVVPFGL